MSKSIPESILHDGIAVVNETTSSNCLTTEKDESLHPSPIFNSTDSLVGTKSLPDTSNIRQQKYSSNTCQSQTALARDAVENKRVELILHMSSIIVQSNSQKTYSVQLNPKETCNCPLTTTCWHIIAAKLSIGIHHALPTK